MNSNALTDEQRALAADPFYLSIAKHIARRLLRRHSRRAGGVFGRYMEDDDIYGCVYLAYVRIVAAWRPDAGRSLKNWLWLNLMRASMRELRVVCGAEHSDKFRALEATIQFAEKKTIGTDDQQPHESELVSNDLHVGWEIESEDVVRAIVSQLPDRSKTAVLNQYLFGQTSREATSNAGAKRTTVHDDLQKLKPLMACA